MSVASRIVKILSGLLIIAGAIILWKVPEIGRLVIILLLGATLLVIGIASLIYYFTMARHMVGGKDTFYKGLIMVDIGLLSLSFSSIPPTIVMVYLVAVFGIAGVLRLLRGLEAKKKQASGWYRRVISGIAYLGITALCQIFIQNNEVWPKIFAIGLMFIGAERIVSSFYRSKIVYVQ